MLIIPEFRIVDLRSAWFMKAYPINSNQSTNQTNKQHILEDTT